jgi:tetratricopeptide (TPR) repeat protein
VKTLKPTSRPTLAFCACRCREIGVIIFLQMIKSLKKSVLLVLWVCVPSWALGAENPAQESAEGRASEGALYLFQEGVKLAQEGNLREALFKLERASMLAPNWALPHLEIAVARMLTDNNREAIGTSLEKAVRLGKELPRAHYLYGVFLQEEGKRKDAISELVEALRIRPSLVDARFRLATLYVEEGRQEEGILQFEYVLQQRQGHVGARRNLAVLYEQSGQMEKAETQMKAIHELFPDNSYHLINLGKFYERAGFQEKAKTAFRKAQQLDPAKRQHNLRPLPKSST